MCKLVVSEQETSYLKRKTALNTKLLFITNTMRHVFASLKQQVGQKRGKKIAKFNNPSFNFKISFFKSESDRKLFTETLDRFTWNSLGSQLDCF